MIDLEDLVLDLKHEEYERLILVQGDWGKTNCKYTACLQTLCAEPVEFYPESASMISCFRYLSF